jgi:uncharacterized ion transporter superfamily protein YfcC
MDLVFVLVVLILTTFFVFKRIKKIKNSDILSIHEEVEIDFETNFERDASGNLTSQGMNDLVEWYEDDLRSRRVLQSPEIEDLEELN